MTNYYGNGSKSDVERYLLNEVPGVTAFRIEEYGKGIVSVFVDGGSESDIAEALYQTMSCGIVMEGTITCVVNGTDIKFSRGAAPKWEASNSYKVGDKVRAPGTFEKVPEEEYQKLGGPVVNPTLRFFSEVCSILGVTPTGAQKEKLYQCLEDLVTPMYTMKISAGSDAALIERIRKMETAQARWHSEFSQVPVISEPDTLLLPLSSYDFINDTDAEDFPMTVFGYAPGTARPKSQFLFDHILALNDHYKGLSPLALMGRRGYATDDIGLVLMEIVTVHGDRWPVTFSSWLDIWKVGERGVLKSGVKLSDVDRKYDTVEKEENYRRASRLSASTGTRADTLVLDNIDEQALNDLAEEMANYKEEPEGLAINPMWRTWYKQWRQTNNSQYKADPLSPGYGQQVPTSTTNETNLGFPLPTAPAIPGTVIWGDSPLVLSGEALRAWGVALDNTDYAAPEIKEDVERLPASPGWAPADAFPPTKSPTTMYVCLSYGCPERAPSPSHEICYTCGKPMSGVMVEEKSDVITLNITCPAVSVSGPAPAGTTGHFVGATDSNVVTYFPGSVAYCDSI